MSFGVDSRTVERTVAPDDEPRRFHVGSAGDDGGDAPEVPEENVLEADESTERVVQRREYKLVLPDSGKLAIIALCLIELVALRYAPAASEQTLIVAVIAIASLGGYALHQWFAGGPPSR